MSKMNAPIRVDCPHCGRLLQFQLEGEDRREVRLKCPACKRGVMARRPPRGEERPQGGWISGLSRARRWAYFGALLSASVLVSLLWLRREVSSPMAKGVRSLAVTGCLKGDSPGSPGLWAFRAHLTEELRLLDALRVAPLDEVERAERDLGLVLGTAPAQTSGDGVLRLDAIAANLGVEAVVAIDCGGDRGGPWSGVLGVPALGETFKLAASEGAVFGSRTDLKELSRDWAGEIRRWLLPAIPEPPRLDLGFPATPEGLEALGKALKYRRDLDYPRVGWFLDAALEADPEAWYPRVLRARFERSVGNVGKAGSFAKGALAGSEEVPEAWRWELQALVAEAEGEEGRALEIWDLAGRLPEKALEARLAQLRLSVAAGRVFDARRSLGRARRLEPPQASDPRLDLAAAEIAAVERDFDAQLEAARAAAAGAEVRRAWTLEAAAMLEEAEALLNLRDVAGALAQVGSAQDLYRRLGDRRGSARTELAQGVVAAALRNSPAAGASFNVALETFRELGLEASEAQTLLQRSRFHVTRGNREQGLSDLTVALALRESLGDRRASLRAHLFASGLLKRLELWERAEEVLRRALKGAGELGDPWAEARALERQSDLSAARGDYAAAIGRLGGAASRLAAVPEPRASQKRSLKLGAVIRLGLADALLRSARLGEAREELKEAGDVLRKLSDEPLRRRWLLARRALGEALLVSGEREEGFEILEAVEKEAADSAHVPVAERSRKARLAG